MKNQAGRPRDEQIDTDLLRAAAQIIEEEGYAKATITSIVKQAGTSAPAFYRRYSSVSEMIPAIIASRHSLTRPRDTGGIATDLQEFQESQIRLFNDPFMKRGLVGWLAQMSTPSCEIPVFVESFLVPQRECLTEILQRADERGEICFNQDQLPMVMDILLSPCLVRTVLPGANCIDKTLVERTVQIVIQMLSCDSEDAKTKD